MTALTTKHTGVISHCISMGYTAFALGLNGPESQTWPNIGPIPTGFHCCSTSVEYPLPLTLRPEVINTTSNVQLMSNNAVGYR